MDKEEQAGFHTTPQTTILDGNSRLDHAESVMLMFRILLRSHRCRESQTCCSAGKKTWGSAEGVHDFGKTRTIFQDA